MIASTSKGKAAAILVAVFAAGGLSGAAVMELVHEDPAPVERERRDGREGRDGNRGRFGQSEGFLRFMNARLELSDEQQASIRAILIRNEKDARELWNGIRADLEAGIEQTRNEIREVLTPEQIERFDAILSEERGRRRGGAPRGSDGPPGVRPPPDGPQGGAPIDGGEGETREGDADTRRPRPPGEHKLQGDGHGPPDGPDTPDEIRGERLGPIARV